MTKRAVVIGINYEATDAPLKGCKNDATRMSKMLIERMGFEVDNVELLVDVEDGYPYPTGANIMSAIDRMVHNAEPDDVLFIHYSGHGTRLPAETGDDDDTGYDEYICPTDGNLITDDDFRDWVVMIPESCRLYILSDSCHSGGVIDESIEQTGESHYENQIEGERQTDENPQILDDVEAGSRDKPVQTLAEMLRQQTGNDDIHVGNLRLTLFDTYGEEASPKMKRFIKGMMRKLENYNEEEHAEMSEALAFLKYKIEEDEEWARAVMEIEYEKDEEIYAGQQHGWLPDGEILISGYQSHQTSSDVGSSPEDAFGALTNALLLILEETDGQITNRDLVLRAREKLAEDGFAQRPGLYCSNEYADIDFLS